MNDAPALEPEVEEPEPDRSDSRTSTPFLNVRLFALLLPLAFVLGLGAGYLVWGQGRSPETQPAAAAPPAAAEATRQIIRYDVPVDDDPFLGPENAAITIIEFSDYECPYCTRWHAEVWPQLQQAYPGQVRLVYRDFPLDSIHANAIPAAEAAGCAGEQGAYWDYHNRLFLGDYGLGREAFDKYASELKLDSAAFEQCLDSRRYQAEVTADYQYAFELGVRSTPTFFVNGIALVGAQPFEVFKQLIDQELAGELPK